MSRIPRSHAVPLVYPIGALVSDRLLYQFMAFGSETLTDAKRRAANELLRANKTADAVLILCEVVAGNGANYRDFLTLARAYDKLGASNEAMTNYRKVVGLVAVDSKSPEERTARLDAERRIELFEQQATKTDGIVDDLFRKVAALEKEAEASQASVLAEGLYRNPRRTSPRRCPAGGGWCGDSRRPV
jgi:hypothetical protein